MTLTDMLIGCGLAILFCQVVTMMFRAQQKKAEDEHFIRLDCWATFFSVVRNLAVVVGTGLVLVLGGLAYAESQGGISAAAAKEMVGLIDTVKAQSASTSGWVAGAVAGGLVIFLLSWMHLRGKRVLTMTMERVREEHMQELLDQYNADELPDMRPDRTMQEVGQQFDHLVQIQEQAIEDEELSDEQRAAIFAKIEEDKADLHKLYVFLDLKRRIPPVRAVEFDSLPRPRNALEWLMAPFVSAAMRKSLGAVGVLSMGVLLLVLMISSLSAVRPAVLAEADTVTVSLKQLYVQDTPQDTDQILQDGQQDDTPITKPTVEEEDPLDAAPDIQDDAYDRLAAILEAEAYDVLQAIDVDVRSAQAVKLTVKAANVRDAILQRSSMKSRNRYGHLQAAKATLGSRARTILDADQTAPLERTAARRRTAAMLRQAAAADPALAKRIEADLASNPEIPQRQRVDSRMAMAVGEQGGRPGRAINEVARVRSERMGREYIAGGDSGRLDRVRAANAAKPVTATGTVDLLDMRSDIQGAVGREVEGMRSDIRSLEDRPAAAVGRDPAGSDPTSSKSAAKRLHQRSRSMGSADALAKFDDYFPAQKGRSLQTPRGTMMQGWDPKYGSSAQVARRSGSSRSFRALRSSRRVGGVLIGNLPDGDGPSTFIEAVDWTIQGDRIQFTITDAQGVNATSPWYDTAMVEQALAYAADGRPLAVTMTSASPLPFLKILVHPVLRDTDMGHHVVELDRFVDTYLSRDKRQEVIQRAYDLDRLYEIARIARALAISGKEDKYYNEASIPIVRQALMQLLEAQASWLDMDDATATRLVRLLGAFDNNPAATHIGGRPAFYDKKLVSMMQSAWPADGSSAHERIKQWSKSINSSASISAMMAGQRFGSSPDFNQWLAPKPEWQEWSGVREQVGTIDKVGQVFAGSDTALGFMLQLAFASEPEFDGTEQESSSWVFTELNSTIASDVAKGIRDNSEHGKSHRESAAFTVIQRFFRLAFSGHLGQTFPIERLGTLHEQLADHAPDASTSPTPRWNHGWLGFGQLEEMVLWKLAPAVVRDAEAKRAEVGGNVWDKLAYLNEVTDKLTSHPDAAQWSGLFPLIKQRLAMTEAFFEQVVQARDDKARRSTFTSIASRTDQRLATWAGKIAAGVRSWPMTATDSAFHQACANYVDAVTLYRSECVFDDVRVSVTAMGR